MGNELSRCQPCSGGDRDDWLRGGPTCPGESSGGPVVPTRQLKGAAPEGERSSGGKEVTDRSSSALGSRSTPEIQIQSSGIYGEIPRGRAGTRQVERAGADFDQRNRIAEPSVKRGCAVVETGCESGWRRTGDDTVIGTVYRIDRRVDSTDTLVETIQI